MRLESYPYMNYSAFDLVCHDTDGDRSERIIKLDKGQAEMICKIIGLIGFTKDQGTVTAEFRVPGPVVQELELLLLDGMNHRRSTKKNE